MVCNTEGDQKGLPTTPENRILLRKGSGSLKNNGNEEAVMVSRQEVALALRRSLLKGRIEPMFGVEEIGDLNEDLNRFPASGTTSC